MIRNILSWIALTLCEAIMIAAFILYGSDMPTEVMIMDMVVCSIIIGLFFVDISRSWDDEHTAKLGSMGVRWTITFIYTFLAVGFMVALRNFEFSVQLLVQGGILMLLLMGLAAALRTRSQIESVHKEQLQKVENRDSVKIAWRDLVENMNLQPDFPVALRERANTMLQDMRYLSPTNNPEALYTDRQLIEGAAEINRMLGDYRMNAEQAEQVLARCERLLQRRRSQYSN